VMVMVQNDRRPWECQRMIVAENIVRRNGLTISTL